MTKSDARVAVVISNQLRKVVSISAGSMKLVRNGRYFFTLYWGDLQYPRRKDAHKALEPLRHLSERRVFQVAANVMAIDGPTAKVVFDMFSDFNVELTFR